jgi:hypothetical protein
VPAQVADEVGGRCAPLGERPSRRAAREAVVIAAGENRLQRQPGRACNTVKAQRLAAVMPPASTSMRRLVTTWRVHGEPPRRITVAW